MIQNLDKFSDKIKIIIALFITLFFGVDFCLAQLELDPILNDTWTCIDPGHGGTDPGALGYNGAAFPDEKNLTLQTGHNFFNYLDDPYDPFGCDPNVLITRNDDSDITLQSRVDIANGILPDAYNRMLPFGVPLDFFVSVHYNASPNTSVHGTSVFCYTNRGFNPATSTPENDATTNCEALIFASNMVDHFIDSTSVFYNNAQEYEAGTDGVWGNNFFVLENLEGGTTDDVAAVLVECEFTTEPQTWDVIDDLGLVGYHAFAANGLLGGQTDYALGQDPDFFCNSLPCSDASGCSFQANITGPSYLGWKESGTWTANVSGGSGSYSYEWRYRYNGTGSWSSVISTSQTCTRTMLDTDFELRVVVTNQGSNATDTQYVTYNNGLFKRSDDFTDPTTQIPEIFALLQNHPNPFNPQTIIQYQLSEPGHVKIKIYNLLGEEVRALEDRSKEAGYYQIQWDGKNDLGQEVSSGIYVYEIKFESKNPDSKTFHQVKKMTLLR